jgi:hypothetical protein
MRARTRTPSASALLGVADVVLVHEIMRDGPRNRTVTPLETHTRNWARTTSGMCFVLVLLLARRIEPA